MVTSSVSTCEGTYMSILESTHKVQTLELFSLAQVI